MNLFSFIKARVAILDVIGEYAALKKAGLYYKGNCPFHHEKTASFTVSPHKDIFYCFGCQASGDVIGFIAKVENCSQREAVLHLIERYHLQVPQNLLEHKEQSDSQKQYYELCKAVADWCIYNLEHSATALGYFTARGFSKKWLQQFQIGYFPGGLQAIKNLIHTLGQKKFLTSDLLDAHIIAQGKQVFYSPFEERLIFPIKDHLGRFCGFGGRVFKTGDERAKYYNSHENAHFNKGSLLFGLDLAKKVMQEKGAAFVVEGYTDCLAMAQHGYPNTVATLGTACTQDHLKMLARHVNTIYVLYDGDRAGQQAILRMAQLCWQASLDALVITLPPAHDPASFLFNKGDLEPYIAGAKDIFSFYIDCLGTPFATLSLNEKLKTADKLVAMLSHIQAGLKRDLLLQQACKTLDIPFESLSQEVERSKPKSTGEQKEVLPVTEKAGPPYLPQISLLEKKLFSVILSNETLLQKSNADYIITYFTQPLAGILQKMVIFNQTHESDNHFFDSLPESEQQLVARLLLECEEENSSKMFEQLLAQFHKKYWKSIVHDIKLKIGKAEQAKNGQEVKELLVTFQELKKGLLTKGHHENKEE